jgi:hypothetical protein
MLPHLRPRPVPWRARPGPAPYPTLPRDSLSPRLDSQTTRLDPLPPVAGDRPHRSGRLPPRGPRSPVRPVHRGHARSALRCARRAARRSSGMGARRAAASATAQGEAGRAAVTPCAVVPNVTPRSPSGEPSQARGVAPTGPTRYPSFKRHTRRCAWTSSESTGACRIAQAFLRCVAKTSACCGHPS